MKKLMNIMAAIILCIAASAQTPQAIKYQAVARNSSGEVIANQNVSFRISIVEGSAQGNTVYEETQSTATNQFGLANLNIGQGNVVSGVFDSIKWGNDSYFAKIEFDPTGGNNYAVMGTSQLMSVPYSLYSAHARVADNMPVFPLKAALQANNLQTPFDEPEIGLLVYNTDSAGSGIYSVVPGYYYNAGTAETPNWVLLSTTNNSQTSKLTPDMCAGTNVSGACSSYLGAGAFNAIYGNGAGGGVGSSSLGNTALGTTAVDGTLGTVGDYNTGIGFTSLISGAGNSSNTAIGANSLYNNTADANTAVGDSALFVNTSGTQLAAVGYEALALNTGSFCTAVGYQAAPASSSATSVTAIGCQALYNNSAVNNTAVGLKSMYSTTSGYDNTAIGYSSLQNNIGGIFNVALGIVALDDNTSGNYNTGVGAYALQSNSTGSENTAIGYQADVSTTNLTNATAIGYQASVGASNTMEFGNTSVAGWGFGGATPTATKVFIVGTTGSNGNGAYLTAGGTWTNASDRNKKENFTTPDGEDILNKICILPLFRWNYKGESNTVKHIGPMAQDFYRTFSVGNDSLSISTIDPAGIALIGIQELSKKLESENAVLKAEISQLSQLEQKQDARSANDERQIAELKTMISNINQAQASIK